MEITIPLKLKMKNNVEAGENAVLYVASKEMFDGIKVDLVSQDSFSRIQDTIDRVVQREIYDKKSGNSGTGNLRRSFRISKGRKRWLFSVLSDPDQGVRIKTGQFAGTGSYGIFFLDPEGLESFIKADNPGSSIRFRPFFNPLKREVMNEVVIGIQESIKKRIAKKLPRVMKPL